MDSLHLRLGLDQKQSVCSIATRCKIEHIHVAEVGVRCASRHRLYDMLSHARIG
jgi:hypothetical protein